MKKEADSSKAENATPAGALSHIRVLDLSRVLAGPWAGQLLGDLGADVIKVERPGHGDDTRIWGPPFITGADGKPGDASYFTAANRNKRSVAVDFANPRGAELVRKLAEKADVIIENFKLGGLKKFGLDYETVSATNPSLIYCSITGFGQDGPYAARPGYDYVIQGMSGVMSLNGRPDGAPGDGPLRVGIALSDLFGGMYASTAILSALVHRERTGEGQYLDCALLAAQVAALANQGASYLTGGTVPERTGNSHPSVAPYRTYKTKDSFMILAVGNDGQFARACGVLGLESLVQDPRYKTNSARIENRAALNEMVEEAIAKWTRDDLLAALEEATVPGGPILNIDEVFANPQVQHRELVQTPTRCDGTRIAVTGYPVKMSRTPATTRRAPPPLGADTAQVLREELGLSDEELEDLKKAGVVSG
ncbi:MAG: CaiB/BaiF CoA transferase family protein [Alphaproteobacteria bacterium]